jgi:hypothetical protein
MNASFPPRPPRPVVSATPFMQGFALVCYALVLGAAGGWLLVADLLRPGPIGFPPDRASTTTGSTASGAFLVAQFGKFRGDLWADAAFADAAAHWPERATPLDRATAAGLDRARTAMETSLALAPVNAEGWLFLATLPSASGGVDPRIASLLGMAYYTAPNAVALAPRRLERAASSSALSDPEIQGFVKTDLHRILSDKPQLRPGIVAAYRSAPPENRVLFESLVAGVDSGFARTLRSGLEK